MLPSCFIFKSWRSAAESCAAIEASRAFSCSRSFAWFGGPVAPDSDYPHFPTMQAVFSKFGTWRKDAPAAAGDQPTTPRSASPQRTESPSLGERAPESADVLRQSTVVRSVSRVNLSFLGYESAVNGDQGSRPVIGTVGDEGWTN